MLQSAPGKCWFPVSFSLTTVINVTIICTVVLIYLNCVRSLDLRACSLAQIGTRLLAPLRTKADFGAALNREQQRCLTQSPPCWSSTMIRTSEPQLGVCCDRSASMFSYLRPSLTSSSPMRPMVPLAWWSRAMQKMNAHSLPELGRMADKLKLVAEEPQRS